MQPAARWAEAVQPTLPASVEPPGGGRSDRPAGRARPALGRLRVRTSELDVFVSVTLRLAERTATGEQTGVATATGALRTVCSATLRAVEQLTAVPVRFEVDSVEQLSSGGEGTIVVRLTLVTTSGRDRLTGAAAVRSDARHAAVRATLAAVNRRLGTLL